MDSKLYVEKRPSEEVFTDSFYDECWPEFHSSPLIKKKGRTPLQMSIDCVEHNIGNTEMCKQICNQFGSVENLIKHANKIRYDHLFARTAWLVYDKSDEKMQFFCMPENYMPNPERFETLVAYQIDRSQFLSAEGIKLHDPVWNRVNWLTVSKRFRKALEQPKPYDDGLSSAVTQSWHLQHLDLFKNKQSIFAEVHAFYGCQLDCDGEDSFVRKASLRNHFVEKGLTKDEADKVMALFKKNVGQFSEDSEKLREVVDFLK